MSDSSRTLYAERAYASRARVALRIHRSVSDGSSARLRSCSRCSSICGRLESDSSRQKMTDSTHVPPTSFPFSLRCQQSSAPRRSLPDGDLQAHHVRDPELPLELCDRSQRLRSSQNAISLTNDHVDAREAGAGYDDAVIELCGRHLADRRSRDGKGG